MRAAVLLALVLLTFAVPAALAWRVSAEVPTLHLDGAFQTFSGLQRLADGQFPGADFFTYLGIGPLWLLFPAFLLAGGDLCASVFAATYMTLLAAELVVAVLVLLAAGRRSWWLGLAVAPLPTIAAWFFLVRRPEAFPDLSAMLAPGNSLRPVRALAPYLIALAALLVAGVRWRPRVRAVVLGAVAGVVGVTWSNDFGLVAMVLFLVGFTLFGVLDPRWRAVDVVLGWVSALLTGVAVGFLATAGALAGVPGVRVRSTSVATSSGISVTGVRTSGSTASGTSCRRCGPKGSCSPWSGWPVLRSTPYGAATRSGVCSPTSAPPCSSGASVASIGGHLAGYFLPFKVWGLLSGTALVLSAAASAAGRSCALSQRPDSRAGRCRNVGGRGGARRCAGVCPGGSGGPIAARPPRSGSAVSVLGSARRIPGRAVGRASGAGTRIRRLRGGVCRAGHAPRTGRTTAFGSTP